MRISTAVVLALSVIGSCVSAAQDEIAENHIDVSESISGKVQVEKKVEAEKFPAFLICPHKESAGSWSLYVIADKNNPKKVLGLGLEELPGKNSRDNTYKGVLAAQKDPSTQRSDIARLDAKNFGSGKLEVKENNLLSIGVQETEDGLKLDIDARVSVDGHFVVGGSEAGHRSLMLKYSSIYNCWQTKALVLENVRGQNAVGKFGLTLTGFVFTAGATSVSRICAVDEFGSPILLLDR